jgi:hypothetical protein
MKNESWVMVMEVFQSQTIAYRSLFMVYGLWFDEKKQQELGGFDDFENLDFQASLMEFFLRYFCVVVLFLF